MMLATIAKSDDLLSEIHGFLSQEAPFLITALDHLADTDDVEAVEACLMDRLAAMPGVLDRHLEAELYPGMSHATAAEGFRDDLELLVRGFFKRRAIRQSIKPAEKLEMLRAMLLTRAVDDYLKECFDKKSVKWEGYASPQKGFRSTGQEAIVGISLRLRRPPIYPGGPLYQGDIIAPMIRDLGAAMMFLDDPLHPILVQWGKLGTPVGGRDLHIGDLDRGVLPPSAPLTISTQTTIGLAYGFHLRGEDRVAVSFVGEGASSLGEWHEAINFAAVKRLGVIFVVENNQWALGTHVSEQTATRRFALRGAGYGVPAATIFGNDPDEVAAAATWAAERAREGKGPTLLELVSYRRSGHAHHDDDRFHGSKEPRIPGYEFEKEARLWADSDPITIYQEKLERLGLLGEGQVEELREQAESEVREAAKAAELAAWPQPADYRGRVYAPSSQSDEGSGEGSKQPATSTRRLSYDEAIREGLVEMMDQDEKVFVLGEDVGGRYGGAFGVTRGLSKRFGNSRCLNTPLAESAIVGCAVGAALLGLRPVVEIQFADFLAPGFNALVNNAAKIHWRWGRAVPMVVRLPYGGATGSEKILLGGGPFHSQCPEMWFLRTPGWKIVAPSTPADAKALMIAAIRDPNPVLYMEAKGLYGFFRKDLREEVSQGVGHTVPIGKAVVRRPGEDLTIVSYGAMVHTALNAANDLAQEKISAEVIDLRSLWPLDEETIVASVRRTHRLLVLHEDTRRGGFAGEITARINELAFFWLDAPVMRVTAPDTPAPYSPPLELDYLPGRDDVMAAARELVAI